MRLAASLPVPPDLPACQRAARRMEELGYDSVWLADTGAGPDAFVLAAAVACVTSKLRIGTAVIPAYTRTPSVFAAGAGSVAQLAPGRFVLGLGASSETIVSAWGGVPFEKPLTQVREATTIIRQMLAGERVTFDGKRLHTKGFRLVSQPPQPVPIYLAALMPPMLEVAGALGDGVILNMMPVDAIPRMLEHVRRGAERAGRDPKKLEIVARFQVIVTDDVTSARGAIRHMLGPYFATSVYNRFAAWCGFEHEAAEILAGWNAKDRARNLAAVTDDMIDRIAIIGSVDECRRKLQAFHDAGVTTPMVHPFLFDERAIGAVLEGLAPGSRPVL
jgi:probable F420-dependent oxidoreductase